MNKGLRRTRNDWKKQKKEKANNDDGCDNHIYESVRLGGVLKTNQGWKIFYQLCLWSFYSRLG